MTRRPSPATGWPERRNGRIEANCLLPSSTPGYFFDLHLTGIWEDLPTPRPHHDPRAAATDHALTVARNITATRHLTDTLTAEARINTLLGQPKDLPDSAVRIVWARVHLATDPRDLTVAIQHLRNQHEADLHQQQHQHRLRRAHDLRDALLSDPALALAHWFADSPETLDRETVRHLDTLVTTAMTYAPDSAWVQVARILTDFVGPLPTSSRQHLIDSLVTLVDRYGRPELATRLHTVVAPTAEHETEDGQAPQISPNGSW